MPDIPPSARRAALVACVLALTFAADAGAQGPITPPDADAPSSPRDVVAKLRGWTVGLSGPDASTDEQPTELSVQRPDGRRDALLRPIADLEDLGCGDTTNTCVPARAVMTRGDLFGDEGLLLTDRNGDGTPEIALEMHFGYADCCKILMGYWREGDGWSVQSLSSGASSPKAVSRGRFRVADADFEHLDWPFSARQTLWSYYRLEPGTGWVDVTTPTDHRREVDRLNVVIKRYRDDPARRAETQAARAVVVVHELRSRPSTGAKLLARYGRLYGEADRRRLVKASSDL